MRFKLALLASMIAAQARAESPSTQTTSFFTTNGSLGIPALGSFITLDNGWRPSLAYAFGSEESNYQVQVLADDANQYVLTGTTVPTVTTLALTSVGVRFSYGGAARGPLSKEGVLRVACNDSPQDVVVDECGVEPGTALMRGTSGSLGLRALLGPSGTRIGWDFEAIITHALPGLSTFVSGTARHTGDDQDFGLLESTEYSGIAGMSLRVAAGAFAGGSHLTFGFAGRVIYISGDAADANGTGYELSQYVQLRVGRVDLALSVIRRHEPTIVGERLNDWFWGIQPTLFY